MERDFRPFQHHQQFGLIGMQPRQQAIQRDEAGAAKEDAVEACAQRGRPAFAGFQLVRLEVRVEVPDETTNPRLGGAMLVVERIQLMHQPFRVNPAQRMPADVELPGVVAQNHGIAQKFVRLNAAPQRRFGGDPGRVRRDLQRVEAQPVEMCLPGGLVAEPCLRFSLQTGDRGRWQALVSHVVVSGVVEHVVSVAGAEQIEEVQPALRGPRAEPGEPLIADLRAKPVLPGMPRAGVVNCDPGRCFQPRAQNLVGFGDQPLMVFIQQANQLPL